MRRRSTALALAVLLAVAVFGRTAKAEGSGLWEAEIRAGFGGAIGQSIRDVFSEPSFHWDRGPVFQTRRKALAIHVGYEGQFDAVWYGGMEEEVEAATGGRWQSGFKTRRSRVGFEAFFLRNFYIRARYGWGSFDELSFQDLFVEWSGLRGLPGDWWPIIRVGQVKEAMTIDWMNNALRTTFAERAMFTTSIVPNRNLGLRVHGIGPRERFTYQLGTYLANVSSLNERKEAEGESVTGRMTALPWAPAGRPNHLLHVGLAASWRWNTGAIEFEAKPESWLGPEIVYTGEIAAKSSSVLVGELFYQRDRLSFTVEGAWNRANLSDGGAADYWGMYGQVSYFLTPGHIPYNRTLGCYGRVLPKRTILCPAKAGFGDWEVAARYSILDLDAGPSPGGQAWSITLALNWYARDNIRVYFNYIYSNVTDAYGVAGADGTMNTLLVRLAYDL